MAETAWGVQVTDGLFGVVKPATQLKALHLSHVRVSSECLDSYAEGGLPELRELTINGIEVTPGSLIALGAYTGLTALGLTNLYQASPPPPPALFLLPFQMTPARRLTFSGELAGWVFGGQSRNTS